MEVCRDPVAVIAIQDSDPQLTQRPHLPLPVEISCVADGVTEIEKRLLIPSSYRCRGSVAPTGTDTLGLDLSPDWTLALETLVERFWMRRFGRAHPNAFVTIFRLLLFRGSRRSLCRFRSGPQARVIAAAEPATIRSPRTRVQRKPRSIDRGFLFLKVPYRFTGQPCVDRSGSPLTRTSEAPHLPKKDSGLNGLRTGAKPCLCLSFSSPRFRVKFRRGDDIPVPE